MYREQEGILSASAESSVFDPREGALGVAADAKANGLTPVWVSLHGVGEFWLHPAEQCAAYRVDDWDALCAAPASRLRVARAPFPDDRPSRPHCELMWHLGYHTASGRLPVGVNRLTVVRMHHWPNFTRLPHTPDMHRLCALLVRRPTSLHLAAKMLCIDERHVFSFFSAAYAAGLIATSARQTVPADEQAPAPEPHSESSLGVMLKQLWNRMSVR